jgi:hypothetical protein
LSYAVCREGTRAMQIHLPAAPATCVEVTDQATE